MYQFDFQSFINRPILMNLNKKTYPLYSYFFILFNYFNYLVYFQINLSFNHNNFHPEYHQYKYLYYYLFKIRLFYHYLNYQ